MSASLPLVFLLTLGCDQNSRLNSLSLTCQVKTNVSFAAACFPADFGLRPKLQTYRLSLTCQVKTNVSFAAACFPSDKLHYSTCGKKCKKK
jgi:hypothetical protein